MARYASITFGGLCLIVQRSRTEDSKKGLYVLMPQAAHHCQVVIAGNMLHSIAEQDGDLRRFGVRGSVGVLPAASMARMSAYAGGVPVASKWLENKVQGAVRARLILPLETKLEPCGDGTDVFIGAPGFGVATFFGVVRATFEVAAGSDVELPIEHPYNGSNILPLPVNGDVAEGTVLNVPLKHVGIFGKIMRKKGELGHHLMHYYDLLEGPPPAAKRAPIYLLKDVGSVPDPAIDLECPKEAIPIELPPEKDSLVSLYADPVNCSVGIGCPPENPNC